jgi:hypothetical protein
VDEKGDILPFCSFNYTGDYLIVKPSKPSNQQSNNSSKELCAYLCLKGMKYYELKPGDKFKI